MKLTFDVQVKLDGKPLNISPHIRKILEGEVKRAAKKAAKGELEFTPAENRP